MRSTALVCGLRCFRWMIRFLMFLRARTRAGMRAGLLMIPLRSPLLPLSALHHLRPLRLPRFHHRRKVPPMTDLLDIKLGDRVYVHSGPLADSVLIVHAMRRKFCDSGPWTLITLAGTELPDRDVYRIPRPGEIIPKGTTCAYLRISGLQIPMITASDCRVNDDHAIRVLIAPPVEDQHPSCCSDDDVAELRHRVDRLDQQVERLRWATR